MLALLHRLKGDEALMLAYQRGDAGAFECLYHRHKDGLYAFLYQSCPRHELVEELAQETWAAVINRAADYQPSAAFRTWLFRIARNRLADHWRRQNNRNDSLDTAGETADTGNDPGAAQFSHQLLTMVQALPPEQRDTLLLQQQGFSLREIAGITDAGEETVKSRLRYARDSLRQQLGETA